jgi:hypothetical protein
MYKKHGHDNGPGGLFITLMLARAGQSIEMSRYKSKVRDTPHQIQSNGPSAQYKGGD